MIREGERVDDLQLAGLRILQKDSGFRFGMDAVLLADFARVEERDRCADFGTGTGILPLLLAGRGKGAHFDAFEIQADMADMAARSVRINALEERIAVHNLPVEEASSAVQPGTLEVIVCNPPYGVPGTTLLNPNAALSTARHQTEAGLTGWFRMAYQLLRGKGRFNMIYPHADKPANLVLIEAMKDAKPMLHPEPPLIVYEADGAMTPELRRIYHITD